MGAERRVVRLVNGGRHDALLVIRYGQIQTVPCGRGKDSVCTTRATVRLASSPSSTTVGRVRHRWRWTRCCRRLQGSTRSALDETGKVMFGFTVR